MFEVMGFREGVLVLPNGRPLPIKIDRVETSRDSVPEMNISIIPGLVGNEMIRDYERRRRSTQFFVDSLVRPKPSLGVKKVIFNDPATIVIWSDDTKTVVKCQPGDTYSKELGLAMCISKKFLGNKGNFNEEFKKWIPEEISVEEMREKLHKFCEEAECSTECLLNKYRCDFDKLSPDEVRQEYKIIFENKEG